MYILLLGGEEEVNMSHWVITEHPDSKTEDAFASGWGGRGGGREALFDCYLLLRVQWLLNLRAVEAWTPAGPPPLCLDAFHLVSVCSTQREAEKKGAARRRKKGKHRWGFSPVVSLRVRSQRSTTEEVCQVLSGADKPMYGLLHAYLLTCGQVWTQSSSL